MANVLGELFKDIADAIRSKNGETGTMKPAEFPEKIADIQPVIVPIEITENGTYTTPEGVDGYNPITVDVNSGGGGSGGGLPVEMGVYLSASPIPDPTSYRHKRFMYNGNLYAVCGKYNSAGTIDTIKKWDGSTWAQVLKSTETGLDSYDFRVAEYNGKAHILSGMSHYIFDGATLTKSTSVTHLTAYPAVYQNELYVVMSDNGGLVKWNEANKSWTTVLESSILSIRPMVINGNFYCYGYENYKHNLYLYDEGNITKIGPLTRNLGVSAVVDDNLYYFDGAQLYRFDFDVCESVLVGTIPNFYSTGVIENANSISFNGATNSSNSRFPFFEVHIVEGT